MYRYLYQWTHTPITSFVYAKGYQGLVSNLGILLVLTSQINNKLNFEMPR